MRNRTAMPIYITGAQGMLARALTQTLRSKGHEPRALSRSECDITSAADVERLFQEHKPAVLVNCAAFTKVDQCEDEPQLADRVNGHAVGLLAEQAKQHSTRLIHISTDSVFSGPQRSPFQPGDATAPLSAYGRSKLLGENLLQKINPPHWMIVRTAWLFGDGHCFPLIVKNRAQAHQPLRIVNDQTGSPTYADDLATGILDLIERNVEGIWHLTNSGSTTWYDLARATLEELQLSADLQPISTQQYRQIKPQQATRAEYTVLDTAAFTNLTGKPLRHWRESLRAYCQKFRTDVAGKK
jgi:dTDP-4-dehydrorhamnose reductase